MCESNFSFAEVIAEKKIFHEFRHHKMLSPAENTADGDIPIPPPCRCEPSDSISDSILVLKILVLNQRTSMQVCHHH